MSARGLILVVEDDRDTAELVGTALLAEGFRIATAATAFSGRGMVERLLPELVVLDRQLPDADGIELCRGLRQSERTKAIPVIFLTGNKRSAEDRVAGLTIGADDYLLKPFRPAELVARVHAILRRTQARPAEAALLEHAQLRLDLDSRRVHFRDKEIRLSPKEFELLQAFLERKQRALSRQFLLSRVWGYGEDLELSPKVVDVTVAHLREKLGAAARMIVAVPKFGYRFEPGC